MKKIIVLIKGKISYSIFNVGILIFLVAIILSTYFNESSYINVVSGDYFVVDNENVLIDDFQIEFYGNMEVKDYTTILIIDNIKYSVRVNHPLKLGNYTIYQNSYREEIWFNELGEEKYGFSSGLLIKKSYFDLLYYLSFVLISLGSIKMLIKVKNGL